MLVSALVQSLILCAVGSAFSPSPKQTTRARLSFELLDSESKEVITGDLPDYGNTSVEIDKIQLDQNRAAWKRHDLFGSSLVGKTLKDLETDAEFQQTTQRLQLFGSEKVSKEERIRRRRALDHLGVPNFTTFLRQHNLELKRKEPKILQINIGLYCNQACAHCHVESSPLRKSETMSAETVAHVLRLLDASPSITTLDITGGAPELNENFRLLVALARERHPDLEIIDRCNLTVLLEPGQEDLIDFLKAHRVRIVASLPCYSAENVNQQRGSGVFERSIAALLALNAAGYGSDPALSIDLVYNPLGAFLPPEQGKLERQYKDQLADNFGILFNSLFTITNMPIKRFADFLHRRDELQSYMDLLVRNFNPAAVARVMCVETVSVDYRGKVYDCDFNQQLVLYLEKGKGSKEGKNDEEGLSIAHMSSLSELVSHPIRLDNHCFGCTSGMGSSCQGTTA